MTPPVWPAAPELPYLPSWIARGSFTRQVGDGRISTAMEVGRPKLRRRITLAPSTLIFTLLLSSPQRGRLERWWDDDTAGGVLPFLIPAPDRDGVPLLIGDAPLLNEAGTPLLIEAWSTVQFVDPLQFQPHDARGCWACQMKLMELP